MTRTSRKTLKGWLIAISIYAVIATIFVVILLLRGGKDTKAATEASSTTTTSTSASTETTTDDKEWTKLPKDQQAEYLGLHAALYVDNVTEYKEYVAERDKVEAITKNMTAVTKAATDEKKFKKLQFDGVGNYTYDGKKEPIATVWTSDDEEKNVNIVIKSGTDEDKWIYLELKPDRNNVQDGKVAGKLLSRCGIYDNVTEVTIDESFFGKQNQDELERKLAYLALK